MRISTKNLVIFGFALILFIIAGITANSYRSLNDVSEHFESYRKNAEFTEDTLGMKSNFLASTYQMQIFLSNPGNTAEEVKNAANYLSAEAYLEVALKTADELLALAANTEREKTLKILKEHLLNYKTIITTIKDDYIALKIIQVEQALTAASQIEETYGMLSNYSAAVGTFETSSAATDAHTIFLQVSKDIDIMIERIDPSFENGILEKLAGLRDAYARIKNTTTEGRIQELTDTLIGEVSIYITSLQAEMDAIKTVAGAVATYHRTAIDLVTEIDELSTELTEEMKQSAITTAKENESDTRSNLLLSGIGILLGILIAGYIAYSLSKTLRRIAGYATEIASGNFNDKFTINEPGEVGAVANALRAIPTALNGIVHDFEAMAVEVETGHLDFDTTAHAYQGSFAQLIKGSTAINRRLKTIIDSIPTPVLLFDADLKATYLNMAAMEMANITEENYKGYTDNELFAYEDFGTSTCATLKAIETLKPASSETVARPDGKKLEVEYTVIPFTNRRGEISAILELITDLTTIKNTQRRIEEVVAQATEVADHVAAASEELSAQMQQMSDGALLQRDRVSSTATAMEEMNATVLDVARNAGSANSQTNMARDKAEEGAVVVSAVVDIINEINSISTNLETDMRELGNKADEVGSVMSVIADIADQTNLLALNAAIEAARAGDAGRGFAVVADEVRKLAENTMSATAEVGNVIQAIQQATTKNIANVGSAVKSISTVTEQANSAGSALQEIVALVSENSMLISGIATASEQQSATSEEINMAIEEINRIVGETSEGVGQSTEAVADLAKTAVRLKTILDDLAHS